MKLSRLGIYGGTFSPPHIGHVNAARAFIREAKLDELLIMPTFIPPHKSSLDIIAPNDRLEMSRIAFGGIPGVKVSDYEINKGGKSYTYLTLEEFSKRANEIFFLVGTDMFLTLDEWKCPEIIFDLATIALVRRERDSRLDDEIKAKSDFYKKKFGAEIIFINAEVTEISSTEIRRAVEGGESTDTHLLPEVRRYIDENKIYRKRFSSEELTNLREAVKSKLSQERYLHTLGVENAALRIADFCLPEFKYEISAAALLHDIAKELARDELQEIIFSDVFLTDEDKSSQKLYHAFAAPYVIKRDFPLFATENILSAVFYHTTGRENMTLFEEIIFVADYVEEGRLYPECIAARERLFSSLDPHSQEKSIIALHECALEELENTEAHLLKKSVPMNSRSAKAKEWIERKINKSR